ncbi:MAG: hypothetical protein H6972_00865 [Gammaproteobacteria bacterium]|nr:hypothetical protein [Gammaproteobacteria bacterium]
MNIEPGKVSTDAGPSRCAVWSGGDDPSGKPPRLVFQLPSTAINRPKATAPLRVG